MSLENVELTEKWESFYRSYYDNEIGKLAQKYPREERSLYIDYQDLFQYDPELAEDLRRNPEEMLRYAEEALHEYDVPVADVRFADANLRIKNVGETTDIRGIRSKDVNTLISVEGIVRKATEVRPKAIKTVFECERCGTTTTITQTDDSSLREPYECKGCERQGPFSLLFDQSEFVDSQKVRVQESPEDLRGGENPQTIDVEIEDDITGEVTPGDRVTVVGVLRATQDGDSTTFDVYIEGNNIEIEDQEFEEFAITDEDEERIEEIASSPDVYEKIVDSIAPGIYGYETEKLAMALQLFSGVTKNLPDETRIRGDMHILMVGDPGTAKSQLLQYVKKIAPRGVYTSGKGSSAAGLTAAAVQDDFGDGKWTLEAGALVLADKGIACVDEVDKMDPKDRSALHEALEQQSVSISKAGINATLKSRCALLGAANPKYGRFDEYEGIAEQIELEPALISRFDLIFTVTDEADEEKDSRLAEHILTTNYAGEVYASDSEVRPEREAEDADEIQEEIYPEIESEMLRKYVAYSRRECKPRMKDEARKRVREFYVDLRSEGEGSDVIPITARKLEALVRLAEASARMRLSDEVEVEDAERAIDIVKESLRDVSYDPETGQLDADIVETGHSSSQRERIKDLSDIIQTIADERDDGKAPREEILETAEDHGMEREKARKELETLQRNGEVIEPSHGHFRLV
ncbi:minichromosome maintenance protein MCM [Halorutilales archaeon Cl-col2-1]